MKNKEYDNMSVDGRVGFTEEKHRYTMIDQPERYFTSVTGLLKNYKEAFDAELISNKLVADPNSKYFGMDPGKVAQDWLDNGRKAAATGTILHKYGEYLLNGEDPGFTPEDDRYKHIQPAIDELWEQGYELAKTELLVYSDVLSLAGQSDILLKKKYGEETFYMIYDWKFLSKPIQKKSYYNRSTNRWKNMHGPFKYLNDCNYIHYSIQLAIYQTLTGDPGKVTEKVLVVITDDGYEFVPAYPMRVFWDHMNELQAVYEAWNGKYYDSRENRFFNEKPIDILGF